MFVCLFVLSLLPFYFRFLHSAKNILHFRDPSGLLRFLLHSYSLLTSEDSHFFFIPSKRLHETGGTRAAKEEYTDYVYFRFHPALLTDIEQFILIF